MSTTFIFQTLQFFQTILIQTFQFHINMDKTLSDASTPGQSGPKSNERVLHISQSSCITWTSPSNYLVSYAGHSFAGYYPSEDEQSVYFYRLSELGSKIFARCDRMNGAFNVLIIFSWTSCVLSSTCHAARTDLPDPLPPPFSFVHHSR